MIDTTLKAYLSNSRHTTVFDTLGDVLDIGHLTKEDWVLHVLVPEIGIELIKQDVGDAVLDPEGRRTLAMQILKESRAYGLLPVR